MLDKNTPIIVGVGQTVEQVPSDLQQCSSHADLAAIASRAAIEDVDAKGILNAIDAIVCTRTFSDSGPALGAQFGKPNNFPRAVAKRLDIQPKHAYYEQSGGQSPQKLVNEFCEKLHAGEHELVLLSSGEAIANMKAATREKASLNWNETYNEQVEDRGINGGSRLITTPEFLHKIFLPMQFYAFMEQARCAESKLDAKNYIIDMAMRIADLSKVAANNPYAMFPKSYEVADLAKVDAENPMIQGLYPKNMIAKDSVNMGAAIVLTTVGKAEELGIDQSKWVFLHGYADTQEKVLLERPNLAHSTAMKSALESALASSKLSANDIDFFDIYSCFPIVVSEACNILGIEKNDSRPLTQTGGLPFFGGPGNSYSTHAIASLVETLRANPERMGMIYANGGWMSKHSTGIYSTKAPEQGWQASCSLAAQQQVDAEPAQETTNFPEGEAVLESFTINYMKGQPVNSIIIGRLKDSQKRFYATNAFKDIETLTEILTKNKIGETIYVATHPRGNRYAFSQDQLEKFLPEKVTTFQESYEYCKVERDGNTLVVTINRPERHNAMNPKTNQELENIFNAFETDKTLWVAVITGAGDKAFSSGNDLKHQAEGGDMWTPKTGFGGLTSRQNRTKPIIAAVNGIAVGGGLEVALAADMIIAAENAMMGLPEVKVGLFAGAGGIQRLTRMIGSKKAMEMIITGELIDAKTALNLGLVNDVVPQTELMSKAMTLAKKVCANSPTAISASMELVNKSSHYSNIDDAVNFEHDVFDRLFNCGDFIEGPTAFVQKRAARWENP